MGTDGERSVKSVWLERWAGWLQAGSYNCIIDLIVSLHRS